MGLVKKGGVIQVIHAVRKGIL